MGAQLDAMEDREQKKEDSKAKEEAEEMPALEDVE